MKTPYTFYLDGNRILNVADSHSGLSLTLSQHEGLKFNVSSWNDDTLHVIAQTMSAAGDRGIPVTVSTNDEQAAFAWALLFYGYSTGEDYVNSFKWVKEKIGSAMINEEDQKWLSVKKHLWSQ